MNMKRNQSRSKSSKFIEIETVSLMNLMNFWKCLPARATLYWPSSVTVVGKCGDRSRSSSKCQDAGKHNGAVRRWAARKILTSQTSRLSQMSGNSSSFTMSNHFQPKTLMNFV